MQTEKTLKTSYKKIIVFFMFGLIIGVFGTSFLLVKYNFNFFTHFSLMKKPLFIVDGKTWETNTLPGDSVIEYFTLQRSIYNAEKEFARQVAARIALSNDTNKTVSSNELPKIEEFFPKTQVSELEAKNYYNKIVLQMGKVSFGGQSFDQVKSNLQMQMTQQKLSANISHKIQELEGSGRIKVLLAPPSPPRVNLNLDGYPTRGDINSKTVFVAVTDYLCTYCRVAEPIIEKMYNDYSTKVKFVNVAYPRTPKSLSEYLARGAFCASKQGDKQFWNYHSQAYKVPFSKATPPKDQDAIKFFINETIEVAKQSKLNVNLFSSCLDSTETNEYILKVQNQFNSSNGFKGTPTFYLNDRIADVNPYQLEESLKTVLN